MKISIQSEGTQTPNVVDALGSGLLAGDLQLLGVEIERALLPQKEYLSEMEYALYRGGKKLRSILLILFARLMLPDNLHLNDKILRGAASVEMLHMATLIHDDIIDGAETRRGLPTVHRSHGTNEAILIGDMQFLQAIRGFTDAIDTQEDMGLVQLVLDTAFKVCCGELDELRNDINSGNLKAKYLKIIERKTAILFGLSCESGVRLAGGSAADARRAGFYGRRFGMAFQIMDDILDFFPNSGKLPGMDLANKTLSLPIIYAMEMGENEPEKLIRNEPGSDFEKAFAQVRNCGAIDRAYSDSRNYIAESLRYLSVFPQDRYSQALSDIANFIVNRS